MPTAATFKRSKRYVILPGQGVVSKTMQTNVLREGSGSSLGSAFNAIYRDTPTPVGSRRLGLRATSRSAGLADLGADEFQVLSQRFEDGPAVVSMSEAAKLAFEAAFPDLRVLPLTRYYLPGLAPRRGKAVAASATYPAGESAVMQTGHVFDNDSKVHALSALQLAGSNLGAGVTVGVIDTGVEAAHPALMNSVSTLRCLIPGASPTAGGPVNWGPADSDRAGHGTHVAGIIGAAPGHGGPPGVAQSAALISYRVFPDNATGPRPAENSVIIDSIRAAIDDGCHIINLSLEGASLKEDGVRSAIADAWNQGVVCIAAAGNGWGLPVSYPAALQHCVAVTAIGRDGAFPPLPQFQNHVTNERSSVDPKIFLAKFSNFGPPVKFAAPGHAIVSTFPAGQWWFQSGTSMAAPFVSGVLARLLSDAPTILSMPGDSQRSTEMMKLLVASASKLGMPQLAQEGYGLPL